MKSQHVVSKRTLAIACSLMFVGLLLGGVAQGFAFGGKKQAGLGATPCLATPYACPGPDWERVGIDFAECCCRTADGPKYKCLCEVAEYMNTETGTFCYRSMYEMYETDPCVIQIDPGGPGGGCLQ